MIKLPKFLRLPIKRHINRMGKDPALLWYWSDWHSGTSLMSRFLKGCYIDVLHAQFNNGRLSLEEIKTCLGSDFGTAWPTLQKKFKKDENDLFFNERLETEKNKRSNFTASRRQNFTKKPHKNDHMKPHMGDHMDNENRNEDVIEKPKGGAGGKRIWDNNPLPENVDPIPKYLIESIQVQYHAQKQKLLPADKIEAYWRGWIPANLNGKKFYHTQDDVYNHFVNKIMQQNFIIDTNGNATNRTGNRGTVIPSGDKSFGKF